MIDRVQAVADPTVDRCAISSRCLPGSTTTAMPLWTCRNSANCHALCDDKRRDPTGRHLDRSLDREPDRPIVVPMRSRAPGRGADGAGADRNSVRRVRGEVDVAAVGAAVDLAGRNPRGTEMLKRMRLDRNETGRVNRPAMICQIHQ
jgi:hypothetical protein